MEKVLVRRPSASTRGERVRVAKTPLQRIEDALRLGKQGRALAKLGQAMRERAKHSTGSR